MSYIWVPIPSLFTFPFILVRSQESVEETMGPLNHFEISGLELIEADKKIALRFEKIGWGNLFKCFEGHNAAVTKLFAMNLKDDVV